MDTYGLQVKDIDDSLPAQPANSWCILFKYSFTITVPTVLLAKVYTPEAVESYTCLRLFDNDGSISGTMLEIPQAFYLLKPQICLPNNVGDLIS